MQTTSICLVLAALTPPPNDPVDDFIEVRLATQHLPGLALSVVRDGKLVKARGYGLANLKLSAPITPDSIFEIASLTKQFTATAIMLLSHEKKLALDDPASRFISGLPEAWNEVTVRHLVTHTSGIPDFGAPVSGPRLGSNYTREALIAHLARAPVRFRPGEGWEYNDFGYYLVGMIIEKAAGEPYAAYLAGHIFPLGMASTRVYDPTEVVPGRVSGYLWKDGRYQRGKLGGQSATLGGGDILSSANDLARWDAAHESDILLPPGLREQLSAPARLKDGRLAPFSLPVESLTGSSYGFGRLIGSLHGHRMIAHGGDISTGFTGYIVRFPDDRLTVNVLTNRSQSEDPFGPRAPRCWEIAHGVAGIYLPGLGELVHPN